jgi:endogenous inhibitor of DNA gyrase (YacG/DUF329 family)
MSEYIDKIEHCPTCGAEVKVVGNVTKHYEPVNDKEGGIVEQTVKCPICGRPYKVYAHTTADQTACPKCVAEAERNVGKYETYDRKR